ncbi:Hypothetical predicted protein [Paramuricea clavata]|uniref:Uncharacterized protein n=1 Tax=Paramuricea clavata TaxID=317549 RepID=A0A6S7G460_PARCT|nr:Hypothetical predicted protein [Paramuricea clavata]
MAEGLWNQYCVPGRVIHNERHQCTGTYLKPITVVDLNGVHHEILFEYCNCFGVPESLLHCGIWPATPVEPNLGFTFQLMEMTLRFMMECHVSIHDMLKTLDFFKNPILKTDGKCFVSADACFGLPRKKASGVSYRQPLSAKVYFYEQQDVDQFMSLYPKSTKESQQSKDCNDFQAGSEIRSKGCYEALDETAVCGLSCKHGIPMKFLNLKGGERLGYAVYMLKDMIERKGNNIDIHFMYDICCLFKEHLKKQNMTDLLSQIQLACPQFHVYGHGATCQTVGLLYSPRRLEGWGMVDGEVMERLWSYLRLFRKMTKEMTASHRENILSDALYFYAKKQRSKIVLLLKAQKQRCAELLEITSSEINELRDNSPGIFTQRFCLYQFQLERSGERTSKKAQPFAVNTGIRQCDGNIKSTKSCAPYFKQDEIIFLLREIKQRKKSLFGMLSSTLTFQMKTKAWLTVREKLVGTGYPHRTKEQLKKKWEDISSSTKVKYAQKRKTGGRAIEWTTIGELVTDILGKDNPTLTSIPGGIDSGATPSVQRASTVNNTTTNDRERLPNSPCLLTNSLNPKTSNVCVTPPSPDMASSKQSEAEDFNETHQPDQSVSLCAKKNTVEDIISWKNTIQHLMEEHDIKMRIHHKKERLLDLK